MEFTATDQAFAVSTAWVIVSVLSKLWQYYVVLQNRSNEYYFPSRRANAVRRARAMSVTRWDHSWSTKSSQRVGFALLALILSYQGTHGSIEPDPPVRDGSIPALEPIDMGDQNCLWMLAVILLMCARICAMEVLGRGQPHSEMCGSPGQGRREVNGSAFHAGGLHLRRNVAV